jgi:hypothetical protein
MVILVPMLCMGMGIGGSASGAEVAAEPRWRVSRQSLGTRDNESDHAKHIQSPLGTAAVPHKFLKLFFYKGNEE